MKRILLFTCLLACSISYAQRTKFKKLPKAILKVSPQHIVRNGLKFGAEFFNETHRFSNEVMFEIISKNNNVFDNEEGLGKLKTSGFLIDYGFKYYFDGLNVKKTLVSEKIGGYYTGFGVQAGSYTETHGLIYYPNPRSPSGAKYSQLDVTSTMYSMAITGGFIKEIANRVYLDLFFGVGMQSGTNKLSESDVSIETVEIAVNTGALSPFDRGIIPRIGFKLGVGI